MEEPDRNSTRIDDVSALSGDIETTLEEAESRLVGFLKIMNANTCNDITSGKLNNKLNKPELASELFHMAKQLESCVKTLKKHRERTVEFQSIVIQCQQDKITLQDKLIKSHEKNSEEIKSVMKTEVRSWSDVVARNVTKQVTSTASCKLIENVVKKVTTEENRSKNLIIHGVEEGEDEGEEETEKKGNEILDTLEADSDTETTVTEYKRIGFRRPGKHRPILARMANSEDVQKMLRKSGKLKKSELHSKVYVDSDRLPHERAERRKLVEELKKRIASDPNQFHCIRHDKVVTMKKTDTVKT